MNKFFIINSKSRLGLQNQPFGGDSDLNEGVVLGGDKIISSLIRNKSNITNIINLDFPNPEEIKLNYLDELAQLYLDGANKIGEGWNKKDILLNLGGDHSAAFMSLLSVLKAKGTKNVCHIQIDSHTDIHSISTSPSGNFHGMWFRPFVDDVGIKRIDNFFKKNRVERLKPKQIMFIGNLNIEKEEKEFIEGNNIITISGNEIFTKQRNIIDFINLFSHLHLSIDVDAFDESIAPGTGIKAKDGLFLEDINFILEIARNHKSLSIDLVEFNPEKDIEDRTLELIKEILDVIG